MFLEEAEMRGIPHEFYSQISQFVPYQNPGHWELEWQHSDNFPIGVDVYKLYEKPLQANKEIVAQLAAYVVS